MTSPAFKSTTAARCRKCHRKTYRAERLPATCFHCGHRRLVEVRKAEPVGLLEQLASGLVAVAAAERAAEERLAS